MAYSLILASSAVLLFLLGLYPRIVQYLQRCGMRRKNYKGEEIPVGVGILIALCQWVALPWTLGQIWTSSFLLQCLILSIITFAGWLDDKYGGNEAKGLRGHFLLWMHEGRVSTGIWKALIGAGVAMAISAVHSDSFFMLILHFTILVLMTNLINLLDLRPGRAIKGFFLLWAPFFGFSFLSIPMLMWVPTVMAAAFLLVDDLRGRVMLGDTGANSLGMALGYWIVLYAPLEWKLISAGGAILIQLYAEKKSISALIQRTPILAWFDMLGRREA